MKKFLLSTALIVMSVSSTAFASDTADSSNVKTFSDNGIISVQSSYNKSCNVIKPAEVTTKNCNFNKPAETTTKNCFEYTTQIVIKPICPTTEFTTQTAVKPTYTTTEATTETTTQAVVKPAITTTEATTETTTQAVV
ncbi:MAG: hypothetical protein Q4D26_11205, partial [Clostridia bacterium]|nr:hypothetical protein [Clostridia bacterium]